MGRLIAGALSNRYGDEPNKAHKRKIRQSIHVAMVLYAYLRVNLVEEMNQRDNNTYTHRSMVTKVEQRYAYI